MNGLDAFGLQTRCMESSQGAETVVVDGWCERRKSGSTHPPTGGPV